MSALYTMNYVGQAGAGFGAMYIGKGVIVGVGVQNARYSGTYIEEGGRIRASVTLTAPPGGAPLVTGVALGPGQSVELSADWPENFADGSPQTVTVMGRPVQVVFQKVGDVP